MLTVTRLLNRAIQSRIGTVALFWAVSVSSAVGQSDSSTPRWAFSAGKSAVILSSPAIGPDHTVYVGVEYTTTPMTGLIVAVQPNGVERWHVATPEEIEGSPAISADGTTVYIGCADGRLYALNAADGSSKWVFDTGRVSAIYCTPAIGPDGTIYIGSTYLGSSGDSVFYAVSPSGQKRWVVSAAGSVESSPAVAPDGTIYFGAGTTVYAIDRTGEEKWTYTTLGPIYAAPALGGDGTVYIGSDGNDFVALSPYGKVKWQYSASVGAGAAIGADGTVYVGATDGKVYALDSSGKLKAGWPFSTGGAVLSVPAIRADGTVLFGSRDRSFYALNPDGSLKWSTAVGDAIETSAAVDSDGTIYIGSAGGVLYSFSGSGAPLSGFSSWPMLNHDAAHRSVASAPITGARLKNLGTRGQAGPGLDLIAGFVVRGSATKRLLVRAVGPTLSQLGVASPMSNPALTVHVSPQLYPNFNDDWGTNTNATVVADTASAVGAFPLPVGSKDAALVADAAAGTAPPINYTMTVDSTDGSAGVVLMEVYDADDPNTATSSLVNLSSRGHVGTGENVLIPGFVIGGPGKLHVLARAVGPGLTQLGVNGVLAQPTVTVFNNDRQPIASNTGWTSGGLNGDLAGAAALVGAFALPDGSADSAMILALDPGAYTFQVSGVNGGTGEALVEVYVLPY